MTVRASSSSSVLPLEVTTATTVPDTDIGCSDLIKVDPHKYLIFNYSKESEEWVSIVTLWNNDFEYNYCFNIEYNKIDGKECFVVRPRKEGHLLKQTGFGRKIVLKVTYDPRNDEPSVRHSKEKLASDKLTEEKMQKLQTFNIDEIDTMKDTRRYFRLQIWKLPRDGDEPPQLFRCQYLLPIFFCAQHSNTEVFVYPPKSITFNRNQGNQFSYWKNNFFIINNASQSVHFKILTTRLPNNCDMVVFPTAGIVQHSFSETYTLKKRHAAKTTVQPETDQDMSGKHYTIVSILLLDPEKAYMTHTAQKPIATIVLLYSFQKHPETENLDELLQWAIGKETLEIFVRDMSHNVAAKNIVVHDKKLLEMAQQNSMDQVYKLDSVSRPSVARNSRSTFVNTMKSSRTMTAAPSGLFVSYNPSHTSTVLAGGNAHDLISHSSVPDNEVVADKAAQMTPTAAAMADGVSGQQLRDAVRLVKSRVANERRITITYGVSDSDIRQMLEELRARGCNALESCGTGVKK